MRLPLLAMQLLLGADTQAGDTAGIDATLDATTGVDASSEGRMATVTTARERALARVAARAAASEQAISDGGPVLALCAPTGAPDEVVLPAAVDVKEVNHVSILPLAIGIRTLGDVCEFLLPRGSSLPSYATRLFTTTVDDQSSALIEMFLGERPFCSGNRFLGTIDLAPLPAHSYRSFMQIEVTLKLDTDGSLLCHAAEVEGRALGDSYAAGEWRGNWLEAERPPCSGRCMPNSGQEVVVFSHALAKHLPVLLATRTVRLLNGRDVVIRQHQRRKEEQVGTGGVLWESAIVLADYVGRNAEIFGWAGKRVLELGAGTGLVAIALAWEGADVCATDGNPKVVEGARRNIEAATGLAPGRVGVEIFDWNSADDLRRMQSAGPWDAIVGSDLVYPGNAGRQCVVSNRNLPPADQTVLSLISSLAGLDTEVVLALKDRTGEVARFIDLVGGLSGDWDLQKAAPDVVMPEFRAMSALAVLHLRRRAPTTIPSVSPGG